jgi:hypothetical protein
MELPSKSKLVEIGGRCFLGRAFILFDSAVYRTHLIDPGIWLCLFYEYGKDIHAEAGKGSLPGVKGCIGSTPNDCLGILSGIPHT